MKTFLLEEHRHQLVCQLSEPVAVDDMGLVGLLSVQPGALPKPQSVGPGPCIAVVYIGATSAPSFTCWHQPHRPALAVFPCWQQDSAGQEPTAAVVLGVTPSGLAIDIPGSKDPHMAAAFTLGQAASSCISNTS